MEKKSFYVSIKNKVARKTDEGEKFYVCGNNKYQIIFDFDEEWAEYPTKTARFKYGGKYQDIVFEGSVCPVPLMSGITDFQVGVFSGNLTTSTPAYIFAMKSILCGEGTPDAPGEDVYSQIIELLNKVIASGGGGGTSGLPLGGKVGQYLRKASDEDGDAVWADLEIPPEYGLVTYDNNKIITVS